jgi:uncharacterized protein YjiS (DUF1127 family)
MQDTYFGAVPNQRRSKLFTTRLAKAFVTYRRRRQATQELIGLSDHQLADIGVTRHDLFVAQRPNMGGRHDHQ